MRLPSTLAVLGTLAILGGLGETAEAATLWTPALVNAGFPPDRDAATACDLIASSAEAHGLDKAFLARLFWQRSAFQSNAADTEGGRGVARIDGATGRRFEIDDRRDIHQSIPGTAAYLAALKARFGNEGLAAAAFEMGEANFAAWMASGRKRLPAQTDNFVFEVTKRDARSFLQPKAQDDDVPLSPTRSFAAACRSFRADWTAAQQAIDRDHPWSAIVAGNWRRATVVDQWTRFSRTHREATTNLQPAYQRWVTPLGWSGIYAAKVYTRTRVAADDICTRLHDAGGVCIVLRN